MPKIATDFNSRPSARGDIRLYVAKFGCQLFQFTPLREGRREVFPTVLRNFYFNSRPSARGDPTFCSNGAHEGISIHAPPRGATTSRPTARASSTYFNSRPSARGDAHSAAVRCFSAAFQFTPLREGRPKNAAQTGKELMISIHAPPRGATANNTSSGSTKDFNSRPSARGDRMRSVWQSLVSISIHAPPRGATVCRKRHGDGEISIHAPPRGATAKDMQFLQIFCSTLTNQHGLTIVPRNLSRLFW